MERITSTQNPKIKNLKKLEKASERREQNLFLIEGLRETVLAYRAGYQIESLFVCEEILKREGEYLIEEIRNQKSESLKLQRMFMIRLPTVKLPKG